MNGAVVVAMSVTLVAGVVGRARAEVELSARLDAVVAPRFADDQPGAAVLVRKGDQVLLRKGYGRANLDPVAPIRPELVFRIGSVTKQFTAVAIMMLVEAGKLSLTDDVRKWVPQYPKHGGPITIQHLLTHTSGIPGYTEQLTFPALSILDLSHEQLLAVFKDLPLDFAPGEHWKYSNSGYYLLGLVIEKASGVSYARFLADKIFTPLGMTHTRYGDNDSVQPGGVRGYQRTPSRVHKADDMSMKPPFAAGALISTVDDLARWDRAIAAGKLLRKESWQRVFTPMVLKDGTSTHYGFGWKISSYEGHRIQDHGGGINGFNSHILRMPDDQVLVVLLCNSIPAPTNLNELAIELAALAIGKPLVDPPIAKLDARRLERYVGIYKVGDTHRLLVRRAGDHLSFQPDGRPATDATPASEATFFVTHTQMRFTFESDPKTGHVTGIAIKTTDGDAQHAVRTEEALPEERASVTVDPAILDRYVGTYELHPGLVIEVTREGARLFTQGTNQQRVETFASSPTEFFLKVVDAQLTFHSEGGAPATHLVLRQAGRTFTAKRLH